MLENTLSTGEELLTWENRQAFRLNHPNLLATTLLSSNEVRIKPTSSLQSVPLSTSERDPSSCEQVHVSDAETEAESGEITCSG